MIAFLALRNLVRSRTRTLLLWAGITVSGALLFDMVMLSGGLEASFRSVLREMNFDIRLVPRGSLPFAADVTFRDGAAMLGAIRGDARVSEARGFYGTSLYISHGAAAPMGVFAMGVAEPAPEIFRARAGALPDPRREEAACLSTRVAEALGVGVGDSVRLAGPSGEGFGPGGGAVTLRVAATGEFRFDTRTQGSIVVPVRVARALRGEAGAEPLSLVALRLRNSSEAPAVAGALRGKFPEADVYEVGDLVARVRGQVSYFNQFSSILGALSFGVAWMLITTLLTLSLNDRLGELAVLRAIGLKPSRLVWVLLAESLAFVAVSVPSGLLLGLVTARFLDALLLQGPGLPMDLHFFVATPAATLRTVALLALAGTLGAIYPMFRAASLPVAATLHESAT